ncbi:uncharacterized membrane protein YoaK (UPF0700 family) [Herbaspirillum sp. Sphag1AN]|uniref:YoaK family protein n=1 Tax=unclassified Herbaspirillum TaxID=2624150 RepID=UPI00160BC7D7|nr:MULTISPECIES: YoaK family protein [unclassified Herbaspirillum]MBB3214218.1 uncharacterized membrane protein YoaK (UPF0700 family) [Herbaspirillum sp. Sphag1AN]MBB3247230.1 uncharacterized membrane protein YoaK (UPF0700 family) [Herbaspirillum sp. Sphag64]
MNKQQRDRFQSISLSFLAGYVDTLGFVALFGLFTAHVTGNFILIGSALANASSASILSKFLAFPAFIAGVAVARFLVLRAEQRQRRALPQVLLMQFALLAGFMAMGLLATPIPSQGNDLSLAAGLFGAAAMGVHSATGKLLLAHLAPTSMMTGNVTQIVIDLIDLALGNRDTAVTERCIKFFWTILAFGVGGILAAFGYIETGFSALLVPLLILLILLGEDRQQAGRMAVNA